LEYTAIYLRKQENERPVLTVDGKNEAIFKELEICAIHSSISHEEEYAIAMVTLECIDKK
jgi:phosphopantetheinyl transferase (holo-ACP synthase)